MDAYSAVLVALRRTPLPRGVALLKRKDDISQPRIEADPIIAGGWIATIYAVRKNGLPLYWPRSAKRQRPTLFTRIVVVTDNPLVNVFRIRNAAKPLLEYAARRLRARRRAIRAARTAMRRGTHVPGPGRPRGILRSMEKTGSNRDRRCLDCGWRHLHLRKPCRIEERER